MTAVALGPEIFSRTRIQGFKNRKRSGCVDPQQVRSIDRNLAGFLQTKATQFQARTRTVNEGNNNKTKVTGQPDDFSFRSVSLVCSTTDLDE